MYMNVWLACICVDRRSNIVSESSVGMELERTVKWPGTKPGSSANATTALNH